MASPQVIDGYTKFANELLEAIIRAPLSKRQYKVLLHIARKTYGYGKKFDDMTVTQIANATGLARPHASSALQELVDMRCVLKRYGDYGYVVGINKNYNRWKGVPKQYTRTKTVQEAYQNSTHKRKLQKKSSSIQALFALWYSTYPNKKAKAQARKAWEKRKPNRDLTAQMIRAVRQQKRWRAAMEKAGRFVPEWKHPATWINGECWEDDLDWPKPEQGNDRGSRGHRDTGTGNRTVAQQFWESCEQSI